MGRLAICLPHLENVKAQYAFSLAAMVLRLSNVRSKGVEEVVTVTASSSILPAVRQELAERAIDKLEATHLLWIDSDHSFPNDTAHRLLEHGRPWVGINATTRTLPLRGTAIDAKLQPVSTGRHEKGLEKVYRMGFGVALIEARVFQAMPRPWFMTEYVAYGDGYVYRGEDIYFSEKAKAAGFAPMVDHDLTKETTHIGAVGFNSTMLYDEGLT